MSAPPMCRCGERLDMPDAPPHKCWATQAAELEALRAEVERLRGALSDIAAALPSECDQCPYWAQWALDGKDINGRPVTS